MKEERERTKWLSLSTEVLPTVNLVNAEGENRRGRRSQMSPGGERD